MSLTDTEIPQSSSLKSDFYTNSAINTPLLKESRSQGFILPFLKSDQVALYLAVGLMIVQSFHTSHALIDLTTLIHPFNLIFGIMTALLMDSLILYFVANANNRTSFMFFLFCSLMNIYAYHIDLDYMTYKSFFSMVPAIGVPYAVHAVSSQLKESF